MMVTVFSAARCLRALIRSPEMKRRHILLLHAGLLTAGCQTTKPAPPKPFSAYTEGERGLFDAVFRYMMRKSPHPEFLLRLLGADAPDDLLARYQAEGLNAFRGSRRFKQGRCVILSISDACRWNGPDKAEVTVDYYMAPLAANSGTLRLRKNNDGWEVVGWEQGPVA
jgi:hypothetical protein